jgi:hypothetical protein
VGLVSKKGQKIILFAISVIEKFLHPISRVSNLIM